MAGTKDSMTSPKTKFCLIPWEWTKGLAELLTLGANKYGDRNWEEGIPYSEIYSALQRHLNAWWSGEVYDPQDGQHHLLSVAWCALVMFSYQLRGAHEFDDRPIYYVEEELIVRSSKLSDESS